MRRFGVAVAWIVIIAELLARGQQTDIAKLKWTVVPSKGGYFLNEEVFVNIELINVSSETLCFPHPDLGCETTSTGSVTTTGEPVDKGERGALFMCHTCGGGKSGDELERAIRNEWIKLAPNGVYVTEATPAWVKLDKAGQWKLVAKYSPPEGAFGDVAKFNKELRSAAKKQGCTLPEETTSEPVYVTVNTR